MTLEQITEISQALTKWREDRHLTTDMQVLGYIPNMLEELTELYRAKDTDERIDALCDMLVFTLNAFPYIRYTKPILNKLNAPIEEIILDALNSYARDKSLPIWLLGVCIDAIEELGYNPYLSMLETIKEISSRSGYYDDTAKKFIKSKGAYSYEEARKLIETSYVIDTEETNTTWTFRLPDEQSVEVVKWYKANYNKAKL